MNLSPGERLDVAMAAELDAGEELRRELAKGLHDLCQPLTTLQCRLEIALMDPTEHEMRAAIVDGLAECGKLNRAIRAMQERVNQQSDPVNGVKQ